MGMYAKESCYHLLKLSGISKVSLLSTRGPTSIVIANLLYDGSAETFGPVTVIGRGLTILVHYEIGMVQP